MFHGNLGIAFIIPIFVVLLATRHRFAIGMPIGSQSNESTPQTTNGEGKEELLFVHAVRILYPLLQLFD